MVLSLLVELFGKNLLTNLSKYDLIEKRKIQIQSNKTTKAEMEKDINTEWDAIAKYKEKVCFLFIEKHSLHRINLMQEVFSLQYPQTKLCM